MSGGLIDFGRYRKLETQTFYRTRGKVINIVGGKWKIMILCVIDRDEVVRYGELRRAIYGITNTMLAQSLREMENDGLVIRKQYDEMPVRVEYSLSEKAETLIPILLELKKWGESNI